jgi:hypothetical protein
LETRQQQNNNTTTNTGTRDDTSSSKKGSEEKVFEVEAYGLGFGIFMPFFSNLEEIKLHENKFL